MDSLKIITHLFPTHQVPYQGKFVADQVNLLLNQLPDLQLSVSVPTPIAIPFTNRYKRNTSQFITSKNLANRFRYLSFPRMQLPALVQKSITAQFEKEISSRTPFELAHIHFLYPGGLLLPFLKRKGIKTVLTIHGSDFYNLHQRSDLQSYIKRSFGLLDKLLLVGPQLVNDVRKHYPDISDKIVQIDNSVDENMYALSSLSDKRDLQSNLGWDSKKIHFLTVGKNRPEKGVDILVEAAKKVDDLSSKAQFHVVGNMHDSQASAITEENEMLDFIPPMPAEKLIQYYQASDAFISPSRREGFGLALIEAAATGLPLLATPTGIAPDFVSQETGILCKDFKASSLEQAIRELILNLETYDSSKIRAKAVSRFGKKAFGSKLINVYNEVLNQ